jgi:hypothetical protein
VRPWLTAQQRKLLAATTISQKELSKGFCAGCASQKWHATLSRSLYLLMHGIAQQAKA